MVKGAASLADSPCKSVAAFKDMSEIDCALLDAYIPGHDRTTTLLMGRIVTNPNDQPHIPGTYGYNLTYNTMTSGKGNALHRHGSVEIFVPLDAPFEFAYGHTGQNKVQLKRGDAIAVPAALNHSYKNVADDHPSQMGRILTVLPGRASITWDNGVVAQARKQGVECSDSGILIPKDSDAKAAVMQMATQALPEIEAADRLEIVPCDSGRTMRLGNDDGWLELSWLHLNGGQVVELEQATDTVAVVIYGSVCCGEQLKALDAVKQPSFFSAAEKSMVLLIKSALPHDMEFFFDP